jgi:hypothetical protein
MKMKKLFVLFVAAALVVAFTVPAMSADWSFYGSARMETFWFDTDEDAGDDNGVFWVNAANSRLGARVKADHITGQVELGLQTGDVYTRIIWGEWNFGGAKLGVGQTYTPTFAPVGNRWFDANEAMLTTGGFYAGRKPMLQLAMGGFKFAAITPQGAVLAGDKSGDVDVMLPKLEASYKFKTDAFSIMPYAGYNTFDVENSTEFPGGYDVTSYVAGLLATMNFGPVYVEGNFTYGQNLRSYGAARFPGGTYGLQSAPPLFGNHTTLITPTGEVKDTTSMTYALALGFKMSDMVAFEGGWGMVNDESDIEGLESVDAMTYYIQARLALAKGVLLVPEVGVYDLGDNAAGQPNGKAMYYGAVWKIDF